MELQYWQGSVVYGSKSNKVAILMWMLCISEQGICLAEQYSFVPDEQWQSNISHSFVYSQQMALYLDIS
jgi:hypothetical protein